MKRLSLHLLLAAFAAGSAFAAETAPPGAAIGAAAAIVQPRAATEQGGPAQQAVQANPPVQAAQPNASEATPAPSAPQAAAPRANAPAAPAMSAASAAPGSAASLLQVIFGLIVVLGLLAAALWALKRFGGARIGAGAPLKIVGGISVGSREKVLVLEVGDQWLVVGVAPGRVSMLTTLPRGEQRAIDAQRPAPDFGAWLKQTLEKRNVK
jgi:flagellar protein FliO/FliZ